MPQKQGPEAVRRQATAEGHAHQGKPSPPGVLRAQGSSDDRRGTQADRTAGAGRKLVLVTGLKREDDMSLGPVTAMTIAAAVAIAGGGAIQFLVGFLLLICTIAVVIIAVRWLGALAGVSVPQPLLLILGIILFMVLLLWLLSWSGLYRV